MVNEPLKDKEKTREPDLAYLDPIDCFDKEDVKSAVEGEKEDLGNIKAKLIALNSFIKRYDLDCLDIIKDVQELEEDKWFPDLNK